MSSSSSDEINRVKAGSDYFFEQREKLAKERIQELLRNIQLVNELNKLNQLRNDIQNKLANPVIPPINKQIQEKRAEVGEVNLKIELQERQLAELKSEVEKRKILFTPLPKAPPAMIGVVSARVILIQKQDEVDKKRKAHKELQGFQNDNDYRQALKIKLNKDLHDLEVRQAAFMRLPEQQKAWVNVRAADKGKNLNELIADNQAAMQALESKPPKLEDLKNKAAQELQVAESNYKEFKGYAEKVVKQQAQDHMGEFKKNLNDKGAVVTGKRDKAFQSIKDFYEQDGKLDNLNYELVILEQRQKRQSRYTPNEIKMMCVRSSDRGLTLDELIKEKKQEIADVSQKLPNLKQDMEKANKEYDSAAKIYSDFLKNTLKELSDKIGLGAGSPAQIQRDPQPLPKSAPLNPANNHEMALAQAEKKLAQIAPQFAEVEKEIDLLGKKLSGLVGKAFSDTSQGLGSEVKAVQKELERCMKLHEDVVKQYNDANVEYMKAVKDVKAANSPKQAAPQQAGPAPQKAGHDIKVPRR